MQPADIIGRHHSAPTITPPNVADASNVQQQLIFQLKKSLIDEASNGTLIRANASAN